MPVLPRRSLLGLRVSPDPMGLLVEGVLPGAAGALAGVQVGDRLCRADGVPLGRASDLVRRLRDGDVSLEVLRGSNVHTLRVRPVPLPLETHPAATVSLDAVEVTVDGRPVRWRTLTTTPLTPADAPPGGARWAVMFVGGLRVRSLERLGRMDALDRVLCSLAEHVVTVRVERGVGDSDGPGPEAIDFDCEQRAYAAALDTLHRAGHRVALLGHSVGGMHAPFLRADRRVVYGTSAERWSRCLAAGARRQLALRGRPTTEIAQAARDAVRFDTPALRERPSRFHTQLERRDLAAAWRRCVEPTLVMHGEFDWVVGREEARALAGIAPRSTFVDVPLTDHAFARHASLADSLEHFGKGQASALLAATVLSFLRSETG